MRDVMREAQGVTTVEFALVIPVLLLLVIGMLDFGRALNAQIVLASASQEGAHYAVLHPTAAPSAINDAARARTAPLAADAIGVTAEYYNGATFVPWPSAGIPASSPTPGPVLVRVSVTYPWDAVTFVVGNFVQPAGPRTLSSSAVMEARR
ncbi:MAG TPA: TadE/TadG family type IV pilus assembly protein [Gemmatimonadales bacterium]|nr:TadE/TadG family type IV pilus assembly protein [Gemmatimonadales bacterium]